MRCVLIALVWAIASPLVVAQQTAPTSNGPSTVVIPQDLQVELRLTEGLSTVTDRKGYEVHLAVASDVVADGIVVARAGTPVTVKLTHAGSRIEFSEPKLTIGGREVRLSDLTSGQRGELGAEKGAAIGIAIFAAPVIAIGLPIQAVLGVRHAIHDAHKREPKRYVFMEKGETFTYYTRDRTRVKMVRH